MDELPNICDIIVNKMLFLLSTLVFLSFGVIPGGSF